MDMINEGCCVCLEDILTDIGDDGNFNCIRLTCCGVCFCKFCEVGMLKSAERTGIPFTCPLCRAPPARNPKDDFDRVLIKAGEGRAWAKERVGEMYQLGKGVKQNYTKAFKFYTEAASMGEAYSHFQIANAYREGRGCGRSITEAFKHFLIAAEKGLPISQASTAHCYAKGEGVEKSTQKAYEWCHKAADKGYLQAQFNVATCFFKGDGVERNYESAAHYLHLAAERNHKQAAANLSELYARGWGVKQNMVKAIYWAKRCLKDNRDERMCHDPKSLIELLLPLSLSQCSNCGCVEKDKLTRICTRCLSVSFCNTYCQLKCWKEGHHKDECRKVE